MATATKNKPNLANVRAGKQPLKLDKAPKPVVEAVVEITFLSPDEIAAMGQAERIAACKPERAALAAWKASGRQGDRPLTPIMSWMENPTVPKKSRTRSTGTPFVMPDDKRQTFTEIVLRERPLGTSWNKIAKLLEAAEIPSSNRGTQWFNKTAFTAAVRLGLCEAGETLNKRDVETPAKPVAAAKKSEPAKRAAKAVAKRVAAKSTASKAKTTTARKAPGQRPAVKAAAKTQPATKGLANLLKIK